MLGMVLRRSSRGLDGSLRRGLALAVVFAVSAAACGSSGGTSAETPTAVAAFFPLAATVRDLAGGALAVRDLTPPGVEPHDLELTSPQMDAILDARLVVVMGQGFQPSVEAGARRRTDPPVVVLDRLHTGRSDPHVWLDPLLMRRVVDLLAPMVAGAVPASQRARVRVRQARLDHELGVLDREYRAGFARCDRRVIVTAHEAFGYLARRYGLRQEAIAGISPEQEPDPRRLAELADLVDRTHTTTVFTETLVSPKVAQTLAREANVATAVLDPIESGPSATAGFAGYLAAMRRNLAALRTALGCA